MHFQERFLYVDFFYSNNQKIYFQYLISDSGQNDKKNVCGFKNVAIFFFVITFRLCLTLACVNNERHFFKFQFQDLKLIYF
jgi:hypothetical protein